MARSKATKALKVVVPRPNAQRLGPGVTSTLQRIAREQGITIQLPPPVQEQPNSASTFAAAESASEWNSLLATARAERGPPWDVGTQQFLVAKDSDLYYDPSELVDAAKTVWNAENSEGDRGEGSSSGPRGLQRTDSNASMNMSGGHMMSPQQHRGAYINQQQMYGNAMHPTMGTSVRTHPGYGSPFAGGVPPGNFYGDTGTPTRMMPDAMRRVTRGMMEDYPGMYGN